MRDFSLILGQLRICEGFFHAILIDHVQLMLAPVAMHANAPYMPTNIIYNRPTSTTDPNLHANHAWHHGKLEIPAGSFITYRPKYC